MCTLLITRSSWSLALRRAPLSQPCNVVGGHTIAAILGVGSHLFISQPMGTPAVASVVAVSASIMAMQGTRTLHPPAGGTALIAVLGSPQMHALGFTLVVPTVLGSSLLVLIALGNNMRGRRYPLYWW